MSSTSYSLLIRLRNSDDEDAWRRFTELYEPLLRYWTRRFPLQSADAADLVQDVLATVLASLPTFERRPGVRFRGWLWTLTLNKYRERLRRIAARPPFKGSIGLDLVTVPSHVEEMDEREYRQYVVRRALELLERDFEPTTWKACWEFVVQARAADEVAREFGISVNAVYLAKSRVLRRLRTELEGLLED